MTEEDLLSAVIELARFAGYKVCHFRPARTGRGWRTAIQGDKGFPDLVIAGRGRCIIVETKDENEDVRPDQWEWIWALFEAGEEVYVWRPEDWLDGTIARALGCEGMTIPARR